MFRICKTVRFEAAHRLGTTFKDQKKAEKIFGKCTNFHGHSYKVDVFVKGDYLTSSMLMNFSELKNHMESKILDVFDHKSLNVVLSVEPTAEKIAQFIFEEMKELIRINKDWLHLDKVRVWETDTCWAEYYE